MTRKRFTWATPKNSFWFIVISYVIIIIVLTVAKDHLEFGDVFSLGQLLVDALLLPAAIIGFLYAAAEFRKSQAKPDIDLYWEVESEGIAKELPVEISSQGGAQGCFLVLLNKGKAVGVWYMLSLVLPRDILFSFPGRHPILGDDDNWRSAITEEEVILTFMSNGQIGAYPEYELILAEIPVIRRRNQEINDQYQVPYTIVTDWGQRVDGFLTLKFSKEANSPEKAV